MTLKLSLDENRNKKYEEFLKTCRDGSAIVTNIVDLGHKLMRKHKLHHHFFENNSLWASSKALAYFGLANATASNNDKITETDAIKILELFERRIADRIPVEYITHEADYAGNKYYVNEYVLVPRSLMNTRFNDFLNQIHWENYRVLDLCAGSGCVGITLALLDSKIQVDLVDISQEALGVASTNIERYNLSDRVRCIKSNLFENVQGKYDLIITNPPYVSTSEYNKSPDEFKNEPKLALEGGVDGLDIIKVILSKAKLYLNPDGILIAEVGLPAAARLKKQYRRVHFQWFKYRTPSGKVSFFNDPGVFLCRRIDLSAVF